MRFRSDYMRLHLLILIEIAFLSGCVEYQTAKEVTDTKSPSIAAEMASDSGSSSSSSSAPVLKGTSWMQKCTHFKGDAAYTETVNFFDVAGVSHYRTITNWYTDAACKKSNRVDVIERKITAQSHKGNTVELTGQTVVDTWRLQNQSLVDRFNKKSNCGKSNWALKQNVSLNGTTCATQESYQIKVEIDHDILKWTSRMGTAKEHTAVMHKL